MDGCLLTHAECSVYSNYSNYSKASNFSKCVRTHKECLVYSNYSNSSKTAERGLFKAGNELKEEYHSFFLFLISTNLDKPKLTENLELLYVEGPQ